MKLIDLIRPLTHSAISGSTDIEITGLSIDSRNCGPGDLFIALRGGEERDRHQFIPDALHRRVSAVLLEDDVPTGNVTSIRVPDIKRACAQISSRFYRHPERDLLSIGVTGTSGKTTTSFLIRSMLDAAGTATGRIGTHHNVVGGKILPSHNTTPFSHDVFRILRAMVDQGDRAVVMEVTSHALALDRVFGIDFKLGVFTNFSRDHLNFHGTIEAYFQAKARLFKELSALNSAYAILNADDPVCERLSALTTVPVITYGLSSRADISPREYRTTWKGTTLTVKTPENEIEISSNLRGTFNLSNLLAAVAVGHVLKLDPEKIKAGLATVQVPGRFECVEAGQPFAVIVDMAHKPDALEKVLLAARSLTTGKVISVFGCGGDRDRGKRPIMGEISARLADLTIVTTDNPRSEEPQAIIDEIVSGIPSDKMHSPASHVNVIPDRKEAIVSALRCAAEGDVVVIAGKGDEDYQEIKGARYPFDDKKIVSEILASKESDSE